MEWLTVIGFILFGLGLIIVEIIFVPGTTIVGIGGLLCSGYGVYLSYDYFGNTVGGWVLGFTGLTALLMLVYALKSNAWDRFSLKDSNSGRVNDDYRHNFNVGEQGEAVSSIKPIGKALFSDEEVEVRSLGTYIDAGQKVKIIRIDKNRIFVEPITDES